jgi:hypothetical protein
MLTEKAHLLLGSLSRAEACRFQRRWQTGNTTRADGPQGVELRAVLELTKEFLNYIICLYSSLILFKHAYII